MFFEKSKLPWARLHQLASPVSQRGWRNCNATVGLQCIRTRVNLGCYRHHQDHDMFMLEYPNQNLPLGRGYIPMYGSLRRCCDVMRRDLTCIFESRQMEKQWRYSGAVTPFLFGAAIVNTLEWEDTEASRNSNGPSVINLLQYKKFTASDYTTICTLPLGLHRPAPSVGHSNAAFKRVGNFFMLRLSTVVQASPRSLPGTKEQNPSKGWIMVSK